MLKNLSLKLAQFGRLILIEQVAKESSQIAYNGHNRRKFTLQLVDWLKLRVFVNLCVCIKVFLTVKLLPQWVGSIQHNVGFRVDCL